MAMNKEETTLSRDVERQDAFKDLGSTYTLEKLKMKIPSMHVSQVLIYTVFAAMFLIGWVTLNSCPVSRMVPVYLIVAGFTGILIKLLYNTENKWLFNILVGLMVSHVIWHIVGSYFVYKEYQPDYDASGDATYCNRIAYLTAFWMITLQYTLLAVFLVLSACYNVMHNDFKM